MDKLKASLSLSDRDKKILMVVLAFGLLALAYFFGYQKFMEDADKYDKETAKLTAKHQDLVTKSAKKEYYIEETKKYQDMTSGILSSYGTGLSQDGSLMFVNGMENANETWIRTMAMTDPTVLYSFGNIRSTNPNGGGAVYSTDMQGIASTYTMAYETSYANLKKLLTYINGYYSKNKIESISMSYDSIEDKVTGSLVMTSYAISGSSRNYKRPKITLPTGTVNLFKSAAFNPGDFDVKGSNGDYILSNYDYYITMNSALSDSSTVVVGKKDDATGKSVLSTKNNEKVNVSVRFSGANGSYKVSYKLGDATYPATNYNVGAEFDPGVGLELLIMSSSRLSAADKSGISLTLINESDMKLNVKICNDDENESRVSIASKTGNIEIFK